MTARRPGVARGAMLAAALYGCVSSGEDATALLGAFAGERTRNTDGVALTQGTIGGLQQGAFYAVHDDSSVSAFAWDGISRALDLACAG